jgi:hypothetical protein
MPLWDEADPHAPEREALADGLQRIERRSASLSLGSEAVSQTNGTGAKQQRLGGQRKRDASGELLRASAGSAGLICLDAERCSWRSITNNFWSVTFVKQPQPKPAVEPSCQRPLLVALSGSGRVCSGPIFDQAVHRGVYAQAGGRSVRNPLLASLANRDDCDRDTAGCRPGHKCRQMLRRRSRRALAEVIDSP